MNRKLRVTILEHDRVIEIPPVPSQNLRVLLLKNKLPLYKGLAKLTNCRGRGICGTCMVRVVDNPAGLTDRNEVELHRLGAHSPQARLACQAFICGDITVDLAKTSPSDGVRIAAEADDARRAHAALGAEA